jgi:hypothetical protein
MEEHLLGKTALAQAKDFMSEIFLLADSKRHRWGAAITRLRGTHLRGTHIALSHSTSQTTLPCSPALDPRCRVSIHADNCEALH